jgi:hypothetical protein
MFLLFGLAMILLLGAAVLNRNSHHRHDRHR